MAAGNACKAWEVREEAANLRLLRVGEWIYGLDMNGNPLAREKSGLWKSPYHNGRVCLEIMRRIDQIHDAAPHAHHRE